MTIRELFDQPGVHLSCEVFPPKVFDKVEEAKAAVRDICALSPAYVSVTCGASGSTPQFTREISAYVQEHGVTALSHLTCVGTRGIRLTQCWTALRRRASEMFWPFGATCPKA